LLLAEEIVDNTPQTKAYIAPMPATAVPYAFTSDFERQLAVAACSRPKLYGRGIHKLDVECLQDPTAKLILTACKVIHGERKKGPESALVVIQRLRAWVGEGRVTSEELATAHDVVSAVEDATAISDESILGELVPVLKRRLRSEALQDTIKAAKDKKSLDKNIETLKEIETLGNADSADNGTAVTPAIFGELDKLAQLERFGFGVDEFDAAMSGGLWRGGQGMFVGGAGDGKSVSLNHIAGLGWQRGFLVGVVTLEISTQLWVTRTIASVMQTPIDDILTSPYIRPKMTKCIDDLNAKGGKVVVVDMPAMITTPNDITAWVERVEAVEGRKLDILIVDYIDKVSADGSKGSSEGKGGTYHAGLMTMETLRLYCARRNIWNWTASQSRRKEKDKKIRDLDDTADSLHKVRVADLVITLNSTDDGAGNTSLTYFIAKNRLGQSRKAVGPWPTNFACARLF
jgi:hypothetical protein